jgi:hypothetical protein
MTFLDKNQKRGWQKYVVETRINSHPPRSKDNKSQYEAYVGKVK